jgi:hypothetical protein
MLGCINFAIETIENITEMTTIETIENITEMEEPKTNDAASSQRRKANEDETLPEFIADEQKRI